MEDTNAIDTSMVLLPGGLIRFGQRYVARDGFNIVAALQLLDNGKPIKVHEFARIFGYGNSKLGRRKAKQQIRRVAQQQYATARPLIGGYEKMPDGTPKLNGELLEIQMFSGNGSPEELSALAELREKKEYLGRKLLGEVCRIEELQKKEPATELLVPA